MAKDVNRAFNIGELQDGKPQQPLPGCLMSSEADIANFTALCTTTCEQILRLLARGLEVGITSASIWSRNKVTEYHLDFRRLFHLQT